MSDVVVTLDVSSPAEEMHLLTAIDAFTKWQVGEAGVNEVERDAPDIMVRTDWSAESLRKTLIFQDRDWAAQFLNYWRSFRRAEAVAD